MFEKLKERIEVIGKPEWRPLLRYVVDLHEKGLHSPFSYLPYMWEEVAPGQFEKGVFGHWETLHLTWNHIYDEPKHAKNQIFNILALQREDGFIPGSIVLDEIELKWNPHVTFPPLWPILLNEYYQQTKDLVSIEKAYPSLEKQIGWFEKHRKTESGGFYYLDIVDNFCESGTEESPRFISLSHIDDISCLDATSHVYSMYVYAERFGSLLGRSHSWSNKKEALQKWIQEKLFSCETGAFHDEWFLSQPKNAPLVFEMFWPMVVGAATAEQAKMLVDRYLRSPDHFFTYHPIPSVSSSDLYFTGDNWKGAVRNSMTFWAALGCAQYQFYGLSRLLLEKALDATAHYFNKSQKILEFYPHYLTYRPLVYKRNPFQDYLGHNPLIAMVHLWENYS